LKNTGINCVFVKLNFSQNLLINVKISDRKRNSKDRAACVRNYRIVLTFLLEYEVTVHTFSWFQILRSIYSYHQLSLYDGVYNLDLTYEQEYHTLVLTNNTVAVKLLSHAC